MKKFLKKTKRFKVVAIACLVFLFLSYGASVIVYFNDGYKEPSDFPSALFASTLVWGGFLFLYWCGYKNEMVGDISNDKYPCTYPTATTEYFEIAKNFVVESKVKGLTEEDKNFVVNNSPARVSYFMFGFGYGQCTWAWEMGEKRITVVGHGKLSELNKSKRAWLTILINK